jgi:hypothetical protein
MFTIAQSAQIVVIYSHIYMKLKLKFKIYKTVGYHSNNWHIIKSKNFSYILSNTCNVIVKDYLLSHFLYFVEEFTSIENY